jgi:hypothetical protein
MVHYDENDKEIDINTLEVQEQNVLDEYKTLNEELFILQDREEKIVKQIDQET